jgi:20S proteasome alpha/beta subunit
MEGRSKESIEKELKKAQPVVIIHLDDSVLLITRKRVGLYKISPLTDRIGFVGIGKFSDFDKFRRDLINLAQKISYFYSPDDISIFSLVRHLATTLQEIWSNKKFNPPLIKIVLFNLNRTFLIEADGNIEELKEYIEVVGGDEKTLKEKVKQVLASIELKKENLLVIIEKIKSILIDQSFQYEFEVSYLDTEGFHDI